MNKRRKQRPPSNTNGKPPKVTRGGEPQNQDHLNRIAKMRELYGLFVKLEETNDEP